MPTSSTTTITTSTDTRAVAITTMATTLAADIATTKISPMAMPQRDDLIEEIKRTDLLLEWAVQHGDEAEAERLWEMLRAIREEVDALYIERTRYRKTGIVFFGLEKPGTAHQTDLFDDTPPAEKSRLYAAVDALNARYGKGKVFSAAQGLGARSWHMKRQKLSRRPTTRWDELMTVR